VVANDRPIGPPGPEGPTAKDLRLGQESCGREIFTAMPVRPRGKAVSVMAKGRSAEHYLVWHTISVDDREAAFGVAGDGPPLVFLHGWALTHRTYRRALRRLVDQGVRVYAPALPGLGGTAELPREDRSLAGYAQWLDRFMATVGIGLPGLVRDSSAAASSSAAPWLAAGMPVSARVEVLLKAMTLDEKVGQMDQQLVTTLTDPNSASCGDNGFNLPNAACMQKILIDQHVGSVLAGGTNNPIDTTSNGGVGNTGFDWANEYNIIQQFAIKNSRLHIPLVFGVDAVHGFGHPWQAPLFPQSIGMGATWDPAAAQAGGTVTANALRATGWVWDFAPVQDLARDNRWGRTYETWAEEPALSAAMGAANVTGLQTAGQGGALNVAATIKHFAGYSQSVNGHDRNEALLPLSYLQSVILPSYAGGIGAGAGAVMVDSGSINAVPATASHYLLTDILRKQMGFKGVVISDYQDVPALQSAYHTASDLPGAIADAVNAGVDMSMEVFAPDQWQNAILQDVRTGKISRARIDQAVRRILTMKFQLGLFDQPCVSDPSKPCVDANAADAAVTAGRGETLKQRRNPSHCCVTAATRFRCHRRARSLSPVQAPTR